MTLPFDYEDLQWYDPVQVQDSVDFFNFMSYDYAVPDASKGTIQAHTDITKTAENLGYIWASGANSSQFNLGIAYYAYSYTIPAGGCTDLGCGAVDAGTGSGCSHDPSGVLPDYEITKIINEQGPNLMINRTAMVAQMTYNGNQFIAFDIASTIDGKMKWADEHCLGGVMVWAVSFATVGAPSQLVGAEDSS